MISLIVTDMDGTLLDDDKNMPKEMPGLLQELYQRDITFAVASGRSHMALTPLFGEMAKEMLFICDNGACVMYPHAAPDLHCLEPEQVKSVLDVCKEEPKIMPVLCGFYHIYYDESCTEEQRNEIQRYYGWLRPVPFSALYEVDEPIMKIALCEMGHIETLVLPLLQKHLGDSLELLVSGNCWMDVMAKGVTKGQALANLQDALGISKEQTMVFGDYDNDISMLQQGCQSYAMENSPQRVKEVAAHIAPPNNENGVVHTICDVLHIASEELL